MSYYRSRYGYKRQETTYEPAVDIQPGDVVWVKWEHAIHNDLSNRATPTTVRKVYDDGNIIHKRKGYDDLEFAWARHVYAKSPGLDLYDMSYHTMELSKILSEVRKFEIAQLDKAKAEAEAKAEVTENA